MGLRPGPSPFAREDKSQIKNAFRGKVLFRHDDLNKILPIFSISVNNIKLFVARWRVSIPREILEAYREGLKRDDLSEREFAEQAGVSLTFLSLWKAGKRKSPKYQKHVRFYKALEGITDIDINDLVLKLTIKEMPHLVPAMELFAENSMTQTPPTFPLSSKTKALLTTVEVNLVSCEEFGPVLEAALKAYIEKTKDFPWIENPGDCERLLKRRFK